ncbi:hypothetical protein PV327_008074 [Microctonus hyperodae]|uniref:Uncharacterized protein n=1 Tax=Microctonus hyperodae TaxID=165561 RepID=A0AA39F2C5_MICHY|nr:hypothetical protein PV327_008074 [Microctonus hyperodae]
MWFSNNPMWFKNTTLDIPGSQVDRTTTKWNPFETPSDNRISERAVKIAIQQYGLMEDETMQVIPFTLEETALATRFVSPTSQTKLWDEIKARTQGTREAVTEYITNMQAMFMQLGQETPMNVQMDIIFKNLHPKFPLYINSSIL